MACGTNFRRTEDTEPSLEDLETGISHLTIGPREPKRRSVRLLDLIQRVRIIMPPPNPFEVESISTTVGTLSPQSSTQNLLTSLGPEISGTSNTDRLGQLQQGTFSSRPSLYRLEEVPAASNNGSDMVVRGSRRPVDQSAEEWRLRRRNREAMVLNDGSHPFAMTAIIEL